MSFMFDLSSSLKKLNLFNFIINNLSTLCDRLVSPKFLRENIFIDIYYQKKINKKEILKI